MKPVFLSILASLLLLFVGLGAICGGLNLIFQPDGSGLQISAVLLRNTPFNSFFWPCIILLVAKGVFSFIILLGLILKTRLAGWLVLIPGFILVGWILIQIKLIQSIISLHWIMGTVGLALILKGWGLLKYNLNHKLLGNESE